MKVSYSRDNGATHRPCHFTLSFTAIPKPQLELIYSSDHGGYIQTQDGTGKPSTHLSMDSWVQVKVPDDHYLLLSVLQLKTENYLETCAPERDVAEIYLGGNTSTHLALKLCLTVRLPPTVYQTTEMFVHFRSNSEEEKTGFRIIFSFHRNSSSPPKLPDGRLNCSVPEWPDFQQHYSCNFVSECVDHEDERNCPYTSPECGPGFVSTGEGCFVIVGHLQASWYEANTYCLSKECGLAILNTRRKLKMFYDIWRA
ncbi:hypothetical protein C0Q70_21334 [Pomacea canaliculata]|uniref:CUB domain-containing protein n=1 Tax=Pomacea canaliculata TaxID=400727 RepID=A0A2T7NCB8_POMCA|nr:hypothetical protein C0Q70_21334 [Pomacea canaliculata]